jgi:hypothetical protein
MKADIQLKKCWSWVSSGLASRRTDWRKTASCKVTLTLTHKLIRETDIVQSSQKVFRNQIKFVTKQRLVSRRYSNLQSVIFICSYDLWVFSKSIHIIQKPLLLVTVTETRGNIIYADYTMCFGCDVFKIHDVSEAGSISAVCCKHGNCSTHMGPLECCNEAYIKYTAGGECLTRRLQDNPQAFAKST